MMSITYGAQRIICADTDAFYLYSVSRKGSKYMRVHLTYP